ncbi:MAG: CoA transferase [SAR202 cluster bacterium]|nr:MAG: CoA transferase [SAR202 cluster bacterium]
MNNSPSLNNLRILDLTRIWAGPLGTRTLGDFGADVIKVSDPRNPISSEAHVNEKLNRNKKNIALRLDTKKGRDIFLELVRISDVLVENYRPRVMRNFNLTYDDIKKVNPNIIMCSMPGFGLDGPYSEFPAFGSTAEAMSGIVSMMGYEENHPIQTGMSYADPVSAINLVGTLLTYARHRSITGEGCFIEIDLSDSPLGGIGEYIVANSVTGYQRPIQGNSHEQFSPHDAFPSKNTDEWIAISITTENEWGKFKEITSIESLNDSKFSSFKSRKKHEEDLYEIISKWTQKFSSTELMELLQQNEIPAGRLSNYHQILSDPHLNSREYFVDFSDINQRYDGQAIPGHQLSKEKWTPMDELGKSSKYILRNYLGYTQSEIDSLEEEEIIKPTTGDYFI